MMTTTLTPAAVRDILRARIGRRSRITRQEMADLLVALWGDALPAVSTIYGRYRHGAHLVGHEVPDLPADTPSRDVAAAQAIAWANCVRAGTVVSVLPGQVRYDQTGTMHPLQQALVSFAPARFAGAEHNPVAYLRRHAGRVLLVRDEEPLAFPHVCAAAERSRVATLEAEVA